MRDQLGELALLVQRAVDHRTQTRGDRALTAEIDAVTEPIAALVGHIETEVRSLRTMDATLAGLDEGVLMRAIAASEARGEAPDAREETLASLEQIRQLEEARAACA